MVSLCPTPPRVYMCTHTHADMHAHDMHTRAYVHTHIVHMYMLTLTYVHLHVRVHAHSVYVYIWVHVYSCTHTHAHFDLWQGGHLREGPQPREHGVGVDLQTTDPRVGVRACHGQRAPNQP